MLSTFIFVLGLFMVIAAIAGLVTGKINLIGKSTTIVRAEKPGAFRTTVAILIVVGAILFGYGVIHMRPGG
jgi:formate/nitrite transporter FocA (FNT family)